MHDDGWIGSIIVTLVIIAVLFIAGYLVGNDIATNDLKEQGYVCPACSAGISFPPGRVDVNGEEILCSHSFHEKNLPYYQLRLKSTKTLEEQAMEEHMSSRIEKKNPEEE